MIISNICEICKKEISDPICLSCYNEELLTWLRENIVNKELIGYIMRKLSRNLSLEYLGIDHCVLCNKINDFICINCYLNILKRILIELNIPDKTLQNFSEIFNNNYHLVYH